MEFVLAFQQPLHAYENYSDQQKGSEASQAWGEYMNAMMVAGVMRGGKQFSATNAVSVSVRDGMREVRDGTAVDTGSLMGGYVLIDVPTLDEALQWAERSPSAAIGATEVWPVLPTKRS
jgi:hypothetical protein